MVKADVSKTGLDHIAIIMDGNGRWAKAKGLSTIAGHRAGAEATRHVVRKSSELGIKYLTLYAFSSENWLRPKPWIEELMGLLRYYLKNDIKELVQNNIRLKIIGDQDKLAPDIRKLIQSAEAETAQNTGLNLFLALSYGSRDEITRATQLIAQKVLSGALLPENITHQTLSDHLYTTGIPDPDLLIRTSGEMRISNFLLWQMAYTELIFADTLWPDFAPENLESAITSYHQRERRYGNVSAPQEML